MTLRDNETEADERLLNNVKSVYPTGEDTTWNHLMSAVGTQFQELDEEKRGILDQIQVSDADDGHLDKVGKLVFCTRRSGETDAHYRGRIRIQLRKYLGGATLEEIKSMSALLLEADTSAVTIRERFRNEPARFLIQFQQNLIDRSEITEEELIEFIYEIRAAGVRVTAIKGGLFTYRSVEDYENGVNDPELAYNNAGYAGLL